MLVGTDAILRGFKEPQSCLREIGLSDVLCINTVRFMFDCTEGQLSFADDWLACGQIHYCQACRQRETCGQIISWVRTEIN